MILILIEVSTGTFYISNKLDTQYGDGFEGALNKFADYLEPDNTLAYAGYDPSGTECVILTEKAFEYGGNQEIAYSYDGEKRTVYTTDGLSEKYQLCKSGYEYYGSAKSRCS